MAKVPQDNHKLDALIESMRKRRMEMIRDPDGFLRELKIRIRSKLYNGFIEEIYYDRNVTYEIAEYLIEDIEKQGFSFADYPVDPDVLINLIIHASKPVVLDLTGKPDDLLKAASAPNVIGKNTFRKMLHIYLIEDLNRIMPKYLDGLKNELQKHMLENIMLDISWEES